MECPERTDEEEFDTVGGLIADRLGRIPENGEPATVQWGGLSFTCLEVRERASSGYAAPVWRSPTQKPRKRSVESWHILKRP